MKAICIPAFNRPESLRKTLAAIPDRGNGWTIYLSLDAPLKIDDPVCQTKFSSAKIWTNGRRLGCSLNVFTAISAAIADGAEAVLHLEDDITLSPDALDLCEWYLANKDFKDVKCNGGIALCRREGNDPTKPSMISVTETWMGHLGQGYCFSRDQWFDFVLRNFWAYDPSWGHDIWDYTLGMMAQKLNKTIVRPRLSRSRHAASTGFNGPGIGIFPDVIASCPKQNYQIE